MIMVSNSKYKKKLENLLSVYKNLTTVHQFYNWLQTQNTKYFKKEIVIAQVSPCLRPIFLHSFILQPPLGSQDLILKHYSDHSRSKIMFLVLFILSATIQIDEKFRNRLLHDFWENSFWIIKHIAHKFPFLRKRLEGEVNQLVMQVGF